MYKSVNKILFKRNNFDGENKAVIDWKNGLGWGRPGAGPITLSWEVGKASVRRDLNGEKEQRSTREHSKQNEQV